MDANADANSDEEGETKEGGDLGEDEELIWRGGDDTVDAVGGLYMGRARGRGGEQDKAPSEDRGETLKGQGEGQSPWAVGGRARSEAFQGRATVTGSGYDASGRGQRGGGVGTGRGRREYIRRRPLQTRTVFEA